MIKFSENQQKIVDALGTPIPDNAPYQKDGKERDYDVECRNHSEMILNAQKGKICNECENRAVLDEIRAEIGKSKTEHEMQLAERDIKGKLLLSHIYCEIVSIIDKYR